MSRAHILGFDSNPAQFARMGNPWVTPREQQELGNSPVSRKDRRGNRRPRPCQLARPDVERIARALTPEEEKAREQRAMLAHVLRLGKSLREEPVLETTGYNRRKVGVTVIKPAASEMWNPDVIHAECDRLARAAETARAELQQRRDALEQAIWGGFAEAMAGALGPMG